MNRLIFRLLYYPLVSMLKIVDMITPRAYMKCFVHILRKSGMKINGMPRYISSDAWFDNFAAITLSERTVISKQCVFLTHDYSPTTAFFTPPTESKYTNTDARIDGTITIKENVFVGFRAVILPNTTIGKNSIIGAGSIVKGNIPEGSVVVGNPAKVLCSIDEYKRKCIKNADNMIWD